MSPVHFISLATPRAVPSSHQHHPGEEPELAPSEAGGASGKSPGARALGGQRRATQRPLQLPRAPAAPAPTPVAGILPLGTASGLTFQAILKSAGRTLLGSCHSGLPGAVAHLGARWAEGGSRNPRIQGTDHSRVGSVSLVP